MMSSAVSTRCRQTTSSHCLSEDKLLLWRQIEIRRVSLAALSQYLTLSALLREILDSPACIKF